MSHLVVVFRVFVANPNIAVHDAATNTDFELLLGKEQGV